MADPCQITYDWKLSKWRPPAYDRAWSRDSCVCRMAAYRKFSIAIRRREAFGPASLAARSHVLRRPKSRIESKTWRRKIQAFSRGKFVSSWSKREFATNNQRRRWVPFRDCSDKRMAKKSPSCRTIRTQLVVFLDRATSLTLNQSLAFSWSVNSVAQEQHSMASSSSRLNVLLRGRNIPMCIRAKTWPTTPDSLRRAFKSGSPTDAHACENN